MQYLLMSGFVSSAPEYEIDSKGFKKMTFMVSCLNVSDMEDKYTHYRCTYHIPSKLKVGDQVFLFGRLMAGIRKDKNGESFVDLMVSVHLLETGKSA